MDAVRVRGRRSRPELGPISVVDPFLGERAERWLVREPVRAVEVLGERVPFLRNAVVALVVRRIGERVTGVQGPFERSRSTRGHTRENR
jgi:hypothetical protein